MNYMTTALYSMVVIGGTAFSSAQADDVWNYAQERAQRQSSAVTQPLETQEKPARKESTSGNKSASRSTGKVQHKPTAKMPHADEQKKSDVLVAPKSEETVTVINPIPETTPTISQAVIVGDEEAINFGKWLKKVTETLRATPDEATLRESFAKVSEQSKQLDKDLTNSNEKLALQQKTLQLVQRKLKELQSPALPQEESRREVFAAGMAAGYGLLDLLDERKKIGIDLSKEDFAAGVQEVMSNGRRLPDEEFESLLSKITERVNLAEREIQQQREQTDLNWKTAFSREQGTLKSAEGIWYQVVYPGDRPTESHETLTLALSRQLTDGTVLEDSDTSGQFLHIKKEQVLPLLKDILNNVHAHGNVKIAMPVDVNGTPYISGPFYELWNIRVSDAFADENVQQ